MDPTVDFVALVAELEGLAPRWCGAAQRIDEAVIVAFEGQHGVWLPADHRRLLRTVGDRAPLPTRHGGAILPLADARDLFCLEHALAPMAEPFPYRGLEPVSVPWDDEADEYVVERWLPGCLPVVYCGCDESRVLVVTGEERGRVWAVTPGGDPELHPTGLSFAEWYAEEMARGLAAERRRSAADSAQ